MQRGHEGSVWTICLVAEPAGYGEYGAPGSGDGAAALPRRCLRLSVQRCKYCIQDGETLVSKVKKFVPETNWFLLWVANGNEDSDDATVSIDDPDLFYRSGSQQVWSPLTV